MSLQNTTRCEALWREDGDVVLLAEDTLFRIHSKELAEQSPFFRNMFSLPPPDNSTYDGCPLFTLPGEKANDVRAMLLVLLNPNFSVSFVDEAITTTRLLELSTKYDVPALRKQILDALAPLFPSTLERCLALRTVDARGFASLAACVRLANVAERAAPQLLPVLLASFLHTQLNHANHDPAHAFYIKHLPEPLSPTLHAALVGARQELSHLSRAHVFPTLFNVPPFYRARHGVGGQREFCCAAARLQVIYELVEWDGAVDALRHLDEYPDMLQRAGFCGTCASKMLSEWNDGLRTLWTALPRVFGINV